MFSCLRMLPCYHVFLNLLLLSSCAGALWPLWWSSSSSELGKIIFSDFAKNLFWLPFWNFWWEELWRCRLLENYFEVIKSFFSLNSHVSLLSDYRYHFWVILLGELLSVFLIFLDWWDSKAGRAFVLHVASPKLCCSKAKQEIKVKMWRKKIGREIKRKVHVMREHRLHQRGNKETLSQAKRDNMFKRECGP